MSLFVYQWIAVAKWNMKQQRIIYGLHRIISYPDWQLRSDDLCCQWNIKNFVYISFGVISLYILCRNLHYWYFTKWSCTYEVYYNLTICWKENWYNHNMPLFCKQIGWWNLNQQCRKQIFENIWSWNYRYCFCFFHLIILNLCCNLLSTMKIL